MQDILRTDGSTVMDIIPDHIRLSLSMDPSTRLSLIKTNTSQTLEFPSGGDFPVYSFGEPAQFFVRFNFISGYAEVSDGLTSWGSVETTGAK